MRIVLCLIFGVCVFHAQVKEVTIGKQIWMLENLNVYKFRNGDPIPEAKTDEDWQKAGENQKPAWCYYENDPRNGEKYGKLYNWYAVNDPRGLAPQGWHVPTDEEWTELTDYLGGIVKSGNKMKSINGWTKGYSGTNESGFNALPGSKRDFFGDFIGIGREGYWWSSTISNSSVSWYRSLFYFNGNVYRNYKGMENGFSVRCLRD